MDERQRDRPDTAAATLQRGRLSPWLLGLATFLIICVLGLALTLRGDPAPVTAAIDPNIELKARQSAPPALGKPIEIPSFGLTVAPLVGWHVISAQENSDNLRSVDMDDKQFQELAIRYANTPVIAFSKYKEPYDDLNPTFKVTVRPTGGFAGHAPEAILAAALPTFSRAFSDMQVQEGPSRAQLAGHDAAYAKLAYTMRARGAAFKTVSEIWLVRRGPIIIMAGTGTREDERNGTRKEVRQIVDQLRIR